jgi:hypothetical protein
MTTTTPLFQSDDKTLYVEVTLPGGTVARWARIHDDGEPVDGSTLDDLTDAIERIIGAPDTIIA